MTTSIDNVFINNLRVLNALTVDGPTTSSHKEVGSDSKNRVQLHQNGSLFYLKFSHVLQIDSFTTTDASTDVLLTLNDTHGVANGSTIHIDTITDAADIGGIDVASIQGTHVVHAVHATDGDKLSIRLGAAATASEVVTAVQPLVRIDRYKSTDMLTANGLWVASTALPTPSHTNLLTFSA
jgi:hypothetical protein